VPAQRTRGEIHRDRLAGHGHGEETGFVPVNPNRRAATEAHLPASIAARSVEGVEKTVRAGVGADDHETVGHERVTVELRHRAVDGCIVPPRHVSRLGIQGEETAPARADEHELPRDRGRNDHSPASLDLPVRRSWNER
jgi:hypothetical protein